VVGRRAPHPTPQESPKLIPARPPSISHANHDTIPPTTARGVRSLPLDIGAGAAISAISALRTLGGGKSGFTKAFEGLAEDVASTAGLPTPSGYGPSRLANVVQQLGGGIQELPTSNAPPTVGGGVSTTGALIAAKPLILDLVAGALGGRSQSGPSLNAPTPGAPTLPSAPWTNPQGQPGGLAKEWDWDWEEWDRENPNWAAENTTTEDSTVAVDWGGLANLGIDFLQGQTGPQSFAGPSTMGTPAPLPAQVTVDTRTGQVKPCRRRRRRRLLTPTDLSDLAALSAIVGKGDALKLAVAKAVRR